MKKDSYELLDDGFLNLYEEGIFIRCFEYSALELGELFGYKLMPAVDKKTGKVFLEVGFPKNKKGDIFSFLEIITTIEERHKEELIKVTHNNFKQNIDILKKMGKEQLVNIECEKYMYFPELDKRPDYQVDIYKDYLKQCEEIKVGK